MPPYVGYAVRCYQCSSSEDLKYEDKCGAYKKFDKRNHIAIDCNSGESHMPGSFCMKVTQQSPKGFICKYFVSTLFYPDTFLWYFFYSLGNGRWRQVIRRCASVADTGVTGVCNWGVYDNGIYWEECYCSEDDCNAAGYKGISKSLLGFVVFLGFYRTFL